MISKYLSVVWDGVAPALGNHLWQSTLFAAAAGLLALALRKNHARARYGLWLAASVKFLVPFSLLVDLGGRLAWTRASATRTAGLYSAMETVSQPFTRPTPNPPAFFAEPSTPSFANLVHLLPMALALVWLAGFLLVLAIWCARWRRLSASMRNAESLREGREVTALRRLENAAGINPPIEMRLTHASLEPGIFGIAQPVLLWPKGICDHLDDAHLEAILTHEVCHVRRHDNLAAALHMLVEAIFWFHPLVWWLGTRLVEERELACDEEVLSLGNPPQLYAESILKVCEFCLESPLACVSGVTGADLKKRIARIMSERLADSLSLGRKVLLVAAGVATIAVPLLLGLANARPHLLSGLFQGDVASAPSFEVVSIKLSHPADDQVSLFMSPGKFTTKAETVKEVIKFAYGIKSDSQLSGGPSWINSAKFDIEAKEDESTANKLQKLPMEEHANQIRLMVQGFLADRFKLKVSRQTMDLPVYALVIAKNGPKLATANPPASIKPGGPSPMFIRRMGPGQLNGTNIGVGLLAEALSREPELGRLVIDQTGLKGSYDWTLKWTPEQDTPMFKSTDRGTTSANSPPGDSFGPSLFAAIQEQLGLKLEPKKGPVEVLVIDSIEKPSEN